MRCKICGNDFSGTVCPRCGYDESQNREQYPTLADDGKSLPANAVLRDAFYFMLADQNVEEKAASSSEIRPQPEPQETKRGMNAWIANAAVLVVVIAGVLLLMPGKGQEISVEKETQRSLNYHTSSAFQTSESNSESNAVSTEAKQEINLSLDKDDLTFFNPGESYTLTARGVPSGYTLTWYSEDNSIVTVDQNGHIITTGNGTATVYASVGSHTASCIVRCRFSIADGTLKSDLDEYLRGVTSEWQVVVIDASKEERVGSAYNCDVEDWMATNRLPQAYIMGAIFQQAEDGSLALDYVIDDVKSMILSNDSYAADRLTERLGDGDAAKGREVVKAFAVANGVKLGFNRPLSFSDDWPKNYTSAQYNAKLLNLICTGKLVSEEASRQMLEILLTPTDSLEIDTGLTAGNGLRYGFITDVEAGICTCVMGVVQHSNRNYVISIICEHPVTMDGSKKLIAQLIDLIKRYF